MKLSYILLLFVICAVKIQGQEYNHEQTQQLPQRVTGNVVMSMMAAYLGMGMLSFASSGEVLREIRDALNLDSDEATDKAFFSLQELLRDAEKAGFLVSSCLFVHSQFGSPRADLVMIARELFSSNIRRLNFDDEEKAMRKINKWAKKTSGGVITDLVYPAILRPVPNVFLANVVYFKSRWRYGFEKIEPQPFFITEDYVVAKNMMYIQQLLRYRDSSSLDAEVIQLPLYNSKTILHILLPRQTSDLDNLEDRVYDLSRDGKLVEELRSTVERPARVWIPKFSFESKNDMRQLFRLVGVRKVFSGTSGGLERLVMQPEGRAGPPLSKAVQAARIDITGYANTINKDLHFMIKEADASAVNFRADRPFFFVLSVDDIIVLLGKYTGIVVANQKPAKNITYCVMRPTVPSMNGIQDKITKSEIYEDGVEIPNLDKEREVGNI